MSEKRTKLGLWQERFQTAKTAFAAERTKMDRREEIYRGSHDIYAPDGKKAREQATHVRNVAFEIVETQVDSNIPQPQVTAVREEDEPLAKAAEDMLRSLLNRLPMERLNDEGERVCPIQGAYSFLVDWDSSALGRGWIGQLHLDLLHPKRVVPQDGIYQVQDMDWLFTLDTQTKQQIKHRYGVDVSSENESDPDVRELEGDSTTDELVTMYTAYYRNERGGIGRYRWVNDTELEDLEDYQVRRVKRCAACGDIGNGKICSCGSKRFEETLMEYEELTEDIVLKNGTVIPAESQKRDENGQPVFQDVEAPVLEQVLGTDSGILLNQMRPAAEPTGVYRRIQEPVMGPTRINFYKPDMYPVILRKNVSQYGRFLGGSDIDAIEDAQNTLNKLSTKINKKVLGGGSFITKKKNMRLISDGDNQVLDVDSPADLECIQVRNMQVDISADLALRQAVYEEGRETIGITDAMQGRKDPTATSKVAKEFSAQQAAGRLESKHTMKEAFFADLFETMFKMMLAYADEPREIVTYDEKGERQYTMWDRHDYLYQDAAGNWKYNTDFLFSCDSSAPLAANREAMWQEARMNLQQGAYGQPTELRSLIRFWTIMETLHYPTAAQVKADLQEELEAQKAAQPVAGPGTVGAAGAMMTAGVPIQEGAAQP